MRKALVVGINHYDHYSPLFSAIEDAISVSQVLSTNEPYKGIFESNFDCKIMLSSKYADKKITRVKLQKEIKELFEQGAEERTNHALLYFSGHGFESSLGGYLVSQDSKDFSEGVSVNDILIYANNSDIENVTIILDCCYSGNMGEVPFLKSSIITIKQGLSILTSSSKKEVSFENTYGGIFTTALVNALNGEGADIDGHVSVLSLYSQACSFLAYEKQTPNLKTHLKQLPILRKVPAKVTYNDFLLLKRIFPIAKCHVALDSYAECDNDRIVRSTEEFDKLLLFEEHGMVSAVDSSNIRSCAIQGKKCKLTDKGRFYWNKMKSFQND